MTSPFLYVASPLPSWSFTVQQTHFLHPGSQSSFASSSQLHLTATWCIMMHPVEMLPPVAHLHAVDLSFK